MAASKSDGYDKAVKYIQDKESVRIGTDIFVNYNSSDKSIVLSRRWEDISNYDYQKYYSLSLKIYTDKSFDEAKLSYTYEAWAPTDEKSIHLEQLDISEIFYGNSKGEKFKYIEMWSEWWGSDEINYKTISEVENTCSKMVSACTTFFKSKGITFKPLDSINKYKEIFNSYREPLNLKISKELPCGIGWSDLNNLIAGDTATFTMYSDLNGDKKKDKITVKCVCLDTKRHDFSLDVKINGKKGVSLNMDFPFEGTFFHFSIFDINPKDKYKELMIDPCGYGFLDGHIYRYTGKKLVLKYSFISEFTTFDKQKNDDYIQLRNYIDLKGICSNIYSIPVDVKPYPDGTIYSKSGIYSIDSDHKWDFNCYLTLYTSTACKKASGSISPYSRGKITKVKFINDNYYNAAFAYVVLDNGSEGWLDLRNNSSEYIVNNPEAAG